MKRYWNTAALSTYVLCIMVAFIRQQSKADENETIWLTKPKMLTVYAFLS